MGSLYKKNTFKQNGKRLRTDNLDRVQKEKVTSIFDSTNTEILQKKPHQFLSFNPIKASTMYAKKLNAAALAIPSGLVLSTLIFTFVIKNFIPTHSDNRYSIFSSKPLTLAQASYDVDSKDSRAQKINEVFKYYNCPLEGMGEVFVREADKNDIPWWLVASVSFQESSCGKNTPKVNGGESYNAWGWAVYGNNTHTFDNWARGVEVVSEYFSNKFFSKGVTDLCDIMKVYTPPSNGSWCNGVQHFADVIQAYQTP